jgi:hypothetical protein
MEQWGDHVKLSIPGTLGRLYDSWVKIKDIDLEMVRAYLEMLNNENGENKAKEVVLASPALYLLFTRLVPIQKIFRSRADYCSRAMQYEKTLLALIT